jgi:hypothetical protein
VSTGKRAYDLLRAYVHQEWDRIQGLERSDALQELDEALDASNANYKITPRPKVNVPPEDAESYARQVLGVPDNADFEAIRSSFEKLCKRSDPARFPEGSSEAKEAADIQKRIYWAYSLLTANVDGTEMRFRSLEID